MFNYNQSINNRLFEDLYWPFQHLLHILSNMQQKIQHMFLRHYIYPLCNGCYENQATTQTWQLFQYKWHIQCQNKVYGGNITVVIIEIGQQLQNSVNVNRVIVLKHVFDKSTQRCFKKNAMSILQNTLYRNKDRFRKCLYKVEIELERCCQVQGLCRRMLPGSRVVWKDFARFWDFPR